MTSWQIYHGPNGSVEPVKEGFHFGAFFFHGFWALVHRLYVPGVAGICVTAASGYLFPSQRVVAAILLFALMLVFGTLGNLWRIGHLVRHGYIHLGTLKASDKKAAELEARNFYTDLQPAATSITPGKS